MTAARAGVALLAAVLAAALAGEAAAQQTVRELMDAGGRMARPDELRGLLGAGPATGASGATASQGAQGGATMAASATGPRIDEAGRGCVDGDCRYYWRAADGRWFVSSSPDTAAPVSPKPAR